MRQDIFNRLNLLRQRSVIRWGGGEIIVAAILLIGILGMGSGMFSRWMRSTRGSGLLLVDLHPFSAANYGVDELPVSVPAIGLEILQDLMGINQPPDTGGPSSIARITPVVPSPTPTALAIATGESTQVPDVTQPDESSPTNEPTTTPTPDLVRSPTPTSTGMPPTATGNPFPPTHTSEPPANSTPVTPSGTPQPSPTPVTPTRTPQPSATPVPATKTSTPSPRPPTNTPLPSPTEPPAATPTAQATRPLAVTPTAQFTPVVSPGPPVLP